MKALFVGGRLNNQIMEVEDIINLPEFSGNFTETVEERDRKMYELFKKGIMPFFDAAPRTELCGQPKIDGYLGPMWDGGHLRYETQEVYDILSC